MDDDKTAKVYLAVQDRMFPMLKEEAARENLTKDEYDFVMMLIAFKLIWYLAGQVDPDQRDSFREFIETQTRSTVREGMIIREKDDEEELKELEKDPDPAKRE